MKRPIFVALAAALLLATMASAEAPQGRSDPSAKSAHARDAKRRYANTAERWRGRPHLRSAGVAHPTGQTTGSAYVYQVVPSANFTLQGNTGGAFNGGVGVGVGGVGLGF